MTKNDMTQWLINNHKEVLNYLKQEFDGDIKDYHKPDVIDVMEPRYYCQLELEYNDGEFRYASIVTETKEHGVAIVRLTVRESDLPQGF